MQNSPQKKYNIHTIKNSIEKCLMKIRKNKCFKNLPAIKFRRFNKTDRTYSFAKLTVLTDLLELTVHTILLKFTGHIG